MGWGGGAGKLKSKNDGGVKWKTAVRGGCGCACGGNGVGEKKWKAAEKQPRVHLPCVSQWSLLIKVKLFNDCVKVLYSNPLCPRLKNEVEERFFFSHVIIGVVELLDL